MEGINLNAINLNSDDNASDEDSPVQENVARALKIVEYWKGKMNESEDYESNPIPDPDYKDPIEDNASALSKVSSNISKYKKNPKKSHKKLKKPKGIVFAQPLECEDINEILKNAPEHKIPDDFIHLEVFQKYRVKLTHFGSCETFYVQVVDHKNENLEKLNERFKKIKSFEPLTDISPGNFCLIESEGALHRASIVNGNSKTAACLCVDTGKLFYFAEKPKLYRLSSKVRHVIPFQAIMCKLFGVKISSDYTYTEFIWQKIIKNIQSYRIEVKSKIRQPLHRLEHKFCNYYEVLLFNQENNQCINDLLIQQNLANVGFE